MSTKPPLPEVIALRCTADLLVRIDELAELLSAASPVPVTLSRSKTARVALEEGVDAMLGKHRKPGRRRT